MQFWHLLAWKYVAPNLLNRIWFITCSIKPAPCFCYTETNLRNESLKCIYTFRTEWMLPIGKEGSKCAFWYKNAYQFSGWIVFKVEILCIALLCRVLNASAEMPGNLSRGERRGNSLKVHKEDKTVKFTSHAIVQFWPKCPSEFCRNLVQTSAPFLWHS